MKPKPVSPMKLFVRELRKAGWVSDEVLRKVLATVLEKDGDLPELEEALIRGGLLTYAQVQELKHRLQGQIRETKRLQEEIASHSEELLEDLKERLHSEIQQAKEKENSKVQALRQKALQIDIDPLKVVVKEIRSKGWCKDEVLRQALSTVLERGGGVRELLQLLLQSQKLAPGQVSYLFSYLKSLIEEKRKQKIPKVQDELSALEESLGGKVTIETRKHPPLEEGPPSRSPSPPSTFRKPHSQNVRILSEDEGGFFLSSSTGEDEDFENNPLF